MAQGDDVDCRQVVAELYSFLDGELTSDLRYSITKHLDGCVDCHEVVDFHAELKMVIAQRCKDDLPVGLQERVLGLLADQTDLGGGGIPRL